MLVTLQVLYFYYCYLQFLFLSIWATGPLTYIYMCLLISSFELLLYLIQSNCAIANYFHIINRKPEPTNRLCERDRNIKISSQTMSNLSIADDKCQIKIIAKSICHISIVCVASLRQSFNFRMSWLSGSQIP